ncbi:MAG: 16S rRNA (guanine(966)-N(2))-methyltransferase RsmD [Ignavibacteriaceae bacterium]
MRIISGEFKGRFIQVPQSNKIRPTTDRVRETLFNLLNNMISFEDILVLDLYAGSGSLGLECISRGAKEVHFVDRDFFIYKNLAMNINSLGVDNKCKIFRQESLRFTSNKPVNKYNLILADPPFFKYDIYKVVENIKHNNYLAVEGILITERSIQTKEKDMENFNTEPFKIIGDTCLYRLD